MIKALMEAAASILILVGPGHNIACELDPELVSDEMLTEIAKSVKIRRS